jgi:hypothetical protein
MSNTYTEKQEFVSINGKVVKNQRMICHTKPNQKALCILNAPTNQKSLVETLKDDYPLKKPDYFKIVIDSDGPLKKLEKKSKSKSKSKSKKSKSKSKSKSKKSKSKSKSNSKSKSKKSKSKTKSKSKKSKSKTKSKSKSKKYKKGNK